MATKHVAQWLRRWPEALVLGLAAWLRLTYAFGSHPVEDEYFELLALRGLTDHLLPTFPSGLFHQRGLATWYTLAPLRYAFGEHIPLLRAGSIILALLLLVLVMRWGERAAHRLVGLSAGLVLALHPAAIVNVPRVRFYGLFILATFLVGMFAWKSARAPHRPHSHIGLAIAFGLALFAHEEAVLLYPPLLMGLTLAGGKAYWRTRAAVWVQAALIAAVLARGGVELAANLQAVAPLGLGGTAKPYLEPLADVADKWGVYRPFYTSPPYLWLSLPFALASLLALLRWRHTPTLHARLVLFLALFPLTTLAFLVFLAGTSWREVRYMLFVDPFWVLAAMLGMWWLLNAMPRLRLAVFGAWALFIAAPLWTPAWNAAHTIGTDWQRPFHFVAKHRQPDDRILTPLVQVCAYTFGTCDYYFREDGFEPYVIEREGAVVDRWVGAPLIHTPDALEALLRAGGRFWLVADGHQIGTRYRLPTQRLLVEQFTLQQTFPDGLRVALAEGWREPPTYTVAREPNLQSGDFTLRRFERTATERPAPPPLHVLLFWDFPRETSTAWHTSLKLVRRDGQEVAHADSAPANGLIATNERPRLPLLDAKTIALDGVPPDYYRLDAVVYDPLTLTPQGERLAFEWLWIGQAPPTPPVRLAHHWRDGLVLKGADPLPARAARGTPFTVQLYWGADAHPTRDWTASVQLLDAEGRLVAQDDHPPLYGFHPTSRWTPDATHVVDAYTLTPPPDAPAGEYTLVVLWYDPTTFERLSTTNGAEMAILGTLTLD